MRAFVINENAVIDFVSGTVISEAGAITYSAPVSFTTLSAAALEQIAIDFRFKQKGVQQNDNFEVKAITSGRTFLPQTIGAALTDGIDIVVTLPSERVAALYQAVVERGSLQVQAFTSLDGVNWNTVAPILKNVHTVADGVGVWALDPIQNLFSKFLKFRFTNLPGEVVNAVVSSILLTLQRTQ